MTSYWLQAVLVVTVIVRIDRRTCILWWANRMWGFICNRSVVILSHCCNFPAYQSVWVFKARDSKIYWSVSDCWSRRCYCWVHQRAKLYRHAGISWQPKALFTLPTLKRTICFIISWQWFSVTKIHMLHTMFHVNWCFLISICFLFSNVFIRLYSIIICSVIGNFVCFEVL